MDCHPQPALIGDAKNLGAKSFLAVAESSTSRSWDHLVNISVTLKWIVNRHAMLFQKRPDSFSLKKNLLIWKWSPCVNEFKILWLHRKDKHLRLQITFWLSCKVGSGIKIEVPIFSLLGKVARKKNRKKCGLLPNWGGAGSRMVVKCQTAILEKYFFS